MCRWIWDLQHHQISWTSFRHLYIDVEANFDLWNTSASQWRFRGKQQKERWYVAPICTKHEQSWLQHAGNNLVIQTHLWLKLSKWSNQQTMEPQQKFDSMGAPLGAAGMLSKRNIPSFLLSLAKGRSPCKTITWALDSVAIFMNRCRKLPSLPLWVEDVSNIIQNQKVWNNQ